MFKSSTIALSRSFALWLVIFFGLSMIFGSANASYQTQRPVQDDGGIINQTYLYGEEAIVNNITYIHHGIDFPDSNGTNVYAIADGKVVAVEEDYADGTEDNFGNYVMVRHNKQQWNSDTNSNVYIYSIYAHLKHNSVSVSINSAVSAGQQIAQIDNTGTSTANHLHLQMVPSGSSNKNDPEEWTWSNAESLNPEMWVEPFDHNGTQTATMVGRVSDTGGNPVGGKYITGAQKPSAAEGGYNFVSALTYSYSGTNSDSLIGENFATTDIQPGTYAIVARNTSATGPVYKRVVP